MANVISTENINDHFTISSWVISPDLTILYPTKNKIIKADEIKTKKISSIILYGIVVLIIALYPAKL